MACLAVRKTFSHLKPVVFHVHPHQSRNWVFFPYNDFLFVEMVERNGNLSRSRADFHKQLAFLVVLNLGLLPNYVN